MTAPVTFVDLTTIIDSAWLNPVSHLTYWVFNYPYNEADPANPDLVNGVPARTPAEARNAIFAVEQSPSDALLYGRQSRGWVEIDPNSLFPEAPLDGISYARQHTGDELDPLTNTWTRSQRVYVQATDPAV